MTTQEAIERAIEGGWVIGVYDSYRIPHVQYEKGYQDYPIGSILTDPSFWQSLKETMEWPDFSTEYGVKMEGWKCKWHALVDHLAEGGTIESYFESL